MDGNGRWASRGPADTGPAPRLGVTTLTLYAFSADNWKRPRREVSELLQLFERYLRAETARCAEQGVRINVIGRRDRLPAGLVNAIEKTAASTSSTDQLHLRIAVDYSARDAIVEAARQLGPKARPSTEAFSPRAGAGGSLDEPLARC